MIGRLVAGVALVAWYVVAFVRSNLQVVAAAMRPRPGVVPTVVVVPTLLRGWRLALLANMVTLTPGTLTIDVTPDESQLVVHTLWAQRPDAVRVEVETLQERLQKVLG